MPSTPEALPLPRGPRRGPIPRRTRRGPCDLTEQAVGHRPFCRGRAAQLQAVTATRKPCAQGLTRWGSAVRQPPGSNTRPVWTLPAVRPGHCVLRLLCGFIPHSALRLATQPQEVHSSSRVISEVLMKAGRGGPAPGRVQLGDNPAQLRSSRKPAKGGHRAWLPAPQMSPWKSVPFGHSQGPGQATTLAFSRSWHLLRRQLHRLSRSFLPSL